MKFESQTVRLAVVVALLLPVFTTVLAQGSLTPPGAPAPTMKTLQQIEPRTPVSAATAPGNFLAQHIISKPGSYYLTTNLVAEGDKRGIQIEADHVTLDLNGFSLLGVSNAYEAIYFPYPTTTNVVVRNGIINGWSYGVYHIAQGARIERLLVTGNGEGIRCGNRSVVTDCTVTGSQRTGIHVSGSGCLIFNNNCADNNAINDVSPAGISVWGYRNRIERNHVTGSGPAGNGIYVAFTNNIVLQNTVIGGSANNYSIPAGNVTGPLINTYGTITNANPWANFSF
jgi:parallel beta-helix repeat protein